MVQDGHSLVRQCCGCVRRLVADCSPVGRVVTLSWESGVGDARVRCGSLRLGRCPGFWLQAPEFLSPTAVTLASDQGRMGSKEGRGGGVRLV